MNKTNLNSTEKHLYKINRGNLLTESENVCSKKIDRLNTNEMVDIFVEEDKKPQMDATTKKLHKWRKDKEHAEREKYVSPFRPIGDD